MCFQARLIVHSLLVFAKDLFFPCCFQEFSPEFTSAFLMQFLRAPVWKKALVSVVVNSSDSKVDRYCRMFLGFGGKATIEFGWPKVVQEFKMEKESIWIFSFRDERNVPTRERNTFAWLTLVVTKLVEQHKHHSPSLSVQFPVY